MAEPIAQQAQVFESSLLDIVSPAGRPKYLGAYQTNNQLMNTLAHLVGRDGRYSYLLACDENGVLQVQAPALNAIAAWDLSALAAAVADINTVAQIASAWGIDDLVEAAVNAADALGAIGAWNFDDLAGNVASIAATLGAAFNANTDRFKVELPT